LIEARQRKIAQINYNNKNKFGGYDMLRSLYSGISGMKVNQTKLDVIGNNIANVGTTAFKGGRVRFQDMLSQTSTEALAPSASQGGVNPKQIGLGVQIAGIDTMVSQGMMQPTSRNLDIAIDGEGYIMVGKGPTIFDTASAINVADDATNKNHTVTNAQGMATMFTRDGALTLDNQGNLLTSDGYRVLGYSLVDPAAAGVESIQSVAGGGKAPGDINFIDANAALTTENSTTAPITDKVLKTLRIPDQVFDNTTGKFIRIKTFSIEKDGVIKAVLDDGRVTGIGQIATASFKNPAGLTKLGRNLYGQSANAGVAVVRSGIGEAAANDNSKGYGDMLQGMLEMSNVDLAEQFTDMIVASRAFQASSKVISTGDEILQDILALKR
jgi:flagellar hook protein FlgE